ncbi:MAG: DUF3822 family protein [Bacteroidia bacterium]|nr:MAG: DUF3822 family protein [Bacteroidia bacterium]
MHERELFDETLDINSTNNYEISIQVSLNGFSFCLLDILRNRFVMLREYRLNGRPGEICNQVMDILNSDEFIGKQYRHYRVIFAFMQTTMVPAGLYDPALKDNYFTINYPLAEGHVVSNNHIDEPDAFLLFDVRKELLDLLVTAFPEASLSHQARPLLHGAFYRARSHKDRYIQVNIEDTYFNLVIIKDRNLEFFNTFRHRNSSDILYYLMHTFEQLGITSDEMVRVSGNIELNDDLHISLSRYIRHVRFAEPVGQYQVSYIFDAVGTHRYINLFNIASCV